MSETSPTISVCLPVYNGERHVRAALDSVLRQTFADLEIVISDNASTDATPEICRKAVANDERVRYFPAEVNRGLAWNFNQAFRRSRGRYIVWLCHDDLMLPEYLERCVKALESDSNSLLCYAQASHIDDAGEVTGPADSINSGGDASPEDRLHAILFDAQCDPIGGLIRADVLRQTRLHGGYADSDRVLLAELGLRGRFTLLPDRLFAKRMHAQQATALFNDRWQRTLIFDPKKAGRAVCPWLRELWDLIGAIRRAPLKRSERRRCYRRVYWWFNVHRRFMLDDVRRGMRVFGRRLTGSRKEPSNQPAPRLEKEITAPTVARQQS
jgi:glycosyltransferase involved in cell wall biosynthesis